MSWKVIDGPKSVRMSRAFAKQFAAMPGIKRDRPLSPARLEHHRIALSSGRFRNPEWATARCKEDGVEYRVNGQHTSSMLAEAPSEQVNGLRAVVTRYECETLEDVASLWATYDNKTTMRSARDIYNTFAGTLDAFDGIGANDIGIIAAGLGLCVESERSKSARVTPEQKGQMLLEQPDFVLWAATIIKRKEGDHLHRAPAVAAMFDCWNKSQSDAKRFWSLVRTGEGVKPTDPDRKLQKFLLQTSIAMGRAANNMKTASQREVYCRCIHAWNAFRKNEQSELKYFANAKIPKAV